MNSLVFISEITINQDNFDIKLIKEEYNREANVNKLYFKSVLQTLEEVNHNKRYYSKEIGSKIIEQLRPIAKSRNLYQEIDHPFLNTSDSNLQLTRSANIEIKNSGSLITDIYLDGNNIIGEIETLSGFKGPDLHNLIKYDKANIGFSVRMFGKLKKHSTINEVSEVVAPIKTVTYDIVSNPSHKKARIIDFVPESANNYYEDSILTESVLNILTCDSSYCPIPSKNIVDEYLFELVKESFRNKKTLLFKIEE